MRNIFKKLKSIKKNRKVKDSIVFFDSTQTFNTGRKLYLPDSPEEKSVLKKIQEGKL